MVTPIIGSCGKFCVELHVGRPYNKDSMFAYWLTNVLTFEGTTALGSRCQALCPINLALQTPCNFTRIGHDVEKNTVNLTTLDDSKHM